MMKVGDQVYRYGRMAEQIARCVVWLRTLNLRPGSRALLYVTNPYPHWILTFALEQVGVTSCAVSAPEAVMPSLDYLRAETLFTRSAPAKPVSQAVHLIDQAWFDMLATLTPAPVAPHPRSPDDILRIIVTLQRMRTLLEEVVEARIRNAQTGGYYSRPDLKMAATFALSAVAGWINALYCFNEGGMLVLGKPWAALAAEVNLFRLAPANLQTLLADLPADFPPPSDLRLSSVGGSLSPALAERAARRLTPDILVNYGATETGTVVMGLIADLDRPDAAGFICPWATVEAVDPEGRPVPADQVGEIRIRSEAVAVPDFPLQILGLAKQRGLAFAGDHQPGLRLAKAAEVMEVAVVAVQVVAVAVAAGLGGRRQDGDAAFAKAGSQAGAEPRDSSASASRPGLAP